MFHDRSDQLSALDDRLELLWHRPFHKQPILLALRIGQGDVDSARLGGDDLCGAVETLFREVHLARIGSVDGDRRCSTEDLDVERRRGRHAH